MASSTGRRRLLLKLLLMLAFVVVAERRLSDGRLPSTDEAALPGWREVRHAVGAPAPVVNCPLVVSLAPHSPYALTSIDRGVQFDVDADGDLDQVAWPEAGSDVSFLAIDQDGDGRITSGRELVGRHTVPEARNGPNALIALATQAADGQRVAAIDSLQPLMSRLLLWTDTNHNGVSEPAELRPASRLLARVGLGFSKHHRRDRHGNESRHRGFVYLKGEADAPAESGPEDVSGRRWMYDACLMTRPGD